MFAAFLLPGVGRKKPPLCLRQGVVIGIGKQRRKNPFFCLVDPFKCNKGVHTALSEGRVFTRVLRSVWFFYWRFLSFHRRMPAVRTSVFGLLHLALFYSGRFLSKTFGAIFLPVFKKKAIAFAPEEKPE